ncbi:hypothetical protein ALSL_0233 [Aerosticca soli]|uniref:Uncharacterized protein n=1 Tax=Aerosticca soli TaxID=2010829 RepID=A0A2Z6E1M8_9GAMM|nr:hypothetical protein ALSL_0233 [Aerosticca soli]
MGRRARTRGHDGPCRGERHAGQRNEGPKTTHTSYPQYSGGKRLPNIPAS